MMKVLALFFVLASSVPALAGVIRPHSPGNNATVSSPFNLSAWSNWCGSQSVVTTGYSLDSSTSTTTFKSQTINTSVSTSAGGHTVHVKAWGNAGGGVTDVAVNVSTSSNVPTGSSSVSALQALSSWTAVHDGGTPGTSSGWMSIVSSPSMSGAARQLATSYTDYGGERYSVSFGDDESAQNLQLDMWVYLQNPSTGVQILEMDLNQVLSNGQTILYGFQCNGWSSTWDFSTNRGSASSPSPHWVSTGPFLRQPA